MAAVQFTNFFSTTLAAPVAIGDTSISVTGIGNLASLVTGGSWMYLTLIDANSWNNNLIPPQTYEIVKVTAVTGTGPYTLTVTRAQDNTTAQAFSRYDIAAQLVNAKSLFDISVTPGSGTVTSLTATSPVVITPSPTTTVGIISAIDFVGSGASHAHGLVPDPGASAGTTKFLREDASWQVPAGSAVSSVSSTDHILTASPTTGAVVVALATTTKGDLIVRSTTNNERLPVGSANQVLTVDSAQTLGVKWAAVPSNSATTQSQVFTASGTFTPATGVTAVKVTQIGGGGGGSSTITAGLGGGGGGAGELIVAYPVNVSGAVTVTIGAAGTAGAAGQGSAQAGGDGGDTSFGSVVIARGGKGGTTAGVGGAGGGVGGATGGAVGAPGTAGSVGSAEAPTHFGGSSGGGGGNTTSANGGAGAGSGPFVGAAAGSAASSQAGGGGGASTIFGVGGAAGNGGVIGTAAAGTSYGAGGGGGGGKVTTTIGGGAGCAGYCLVEWVA